MQLLTKCAVISDEVKLPYVEKGDRSGVPVILLHGVTDSLRSYDLLLPHLPEWVHAFALTQRGHGDASRPENGYFARDFAADIAGLMDCVGIDSAVIVGHSMGSFNAQRFAIDCPSRVLGLVLIGSFTTCKDNQGVIDFVENAIKPFEDPIPAEFAREFQQSTIAQPVPPDFFETVVEESLKVPARVWKAACESMLLNDNSAELGEIKAPTLLIWGERDAYFSRDEQEKLREKISGSELVVYPNIGHCPQWEAPETVAADIVDFIKIYVGEKRDAASRELSYLA